MIDPVSGRSAKSAERWNDLRRRVISASILAPLVLLCIWFGGLAFDVLMLVGAIGLSIEWVGLCQAKSTTPSGLVVVTALSLTTVAACVGHAGAGVAFLVVGAGLAGWLGRRGLLGAGVIGIGLGVLALVWLRGGDTVDGRWAVLFVVLIVWASDIGAYTAGRIFGGPKLAPSLSPAKTWAGAAGGLIAAVVVGEVLAGRLGITTGLVAGLLALMCQAGDLLESGIKRHVGVKDSGHLIPGHGGLLDRLDGLLAAAPVAALVVLAREGLFWQ